MSLNKFYVEKAEKQQLGIIYVKNNWTRPLNIENMISSEP